MVREGVESAPLAGLWLAASLGLIATALVEQVAQPRPRWQRPWQAWALHAGTWLVLHALLASLLARPWFAAVTLLAGWIALMLVSRAKWRALREPFVWPDYQYLLDALRHPRLYLPFMGWGKWLGLAAAIAASAAAGFMLEEARSVSRGWSGLLAEAAVQAGLGAAALLAGIAAGGKRRVGDPAADVQSHGMVACAWDQALALRHLPMAVSPFQTRALPNGWPVSDLPHLVAVQSESFFDPRPWCAAVKPEVLAAFDRVRRQALLQGRVTVPAWGANTVRSEFAFLSGLGPEMLGGHRFEPYRAVATGWQVASVASWLRRLGYRTLCLHPFDGRFYRRDRVMPALGFDEFWDIGWFADAPHCGAFVSDVALAQRVAMLLRTARQPLFVFVITMENHGPLHLESVQPQEIPDYLICDLPRGANELVAYLRHLRQADRMIALLCQAMMACDRNASLCWYGDHVPIMPRAYAAWGVPPGLVDYLIWHNTVRSQTDRVRDMPVHRLAQAWLDVLGLEAARVPSPSPQQENV